LLAPWGLPINCLPINCLPINRGLINFGLVVELSWVDLGMVPGIRVLYSQGVVFWTTDDKP
jgi:hypothetical protein